MYKYRGKYKKSHTCIHAIEPLMVMVIVDTDCPNKVQYSSAIMIDKYICEACESYKPEVD